MRNHNYFNKNSSNVKCHRGNCGNINLYFFTVNYAMSCFFFFTFKNCQFNGILL